MVTRCGCANAADGLPSGAAAIPFGTEPRHVSGRGSTFSTPMPVDLVNPESNSSADLRSRGYAFIAPNGYRYWYGYFFGPFRGSSR